MSLYNLNAKEYAVKLGLFSSIEELIAHELELIETWYPGLENLTNDEIQRYYRCESDHQFQVLVALQRKTANENLQKR